MIQHNKLISQTIFAILNQIITRLDLDINTKQISIYTDSICENL